MMLPGIDAARLFRKLHGSRWIIGGGGTVGQPPWFSDSSEIDPRNTFGTS